MNAPSEKAVLFRSGDATLVGILHAGVGKPRSHGVLIVVGGPQYRVGSHRQFLITARQLARQGYAVFRFDYQGMGDSEGTFSGFEKCGDDIRAAIDVFLRECPHLRGVNLFGLCDGASAALMYAPNDDRVIGLMLANPWVRTETTQAATYLRHYYWKRLFQASFWLKLLKGGLNVRGSLGGLSANVRQARSSDSRESAVSYVVRMRDALRSYSGRLLLLLSGDDLTAREFVDLFDRDKHWIAASKKSRITRIDLPDADHTFSKRPALDEAGEHCVAWLGIEEGR